jgi:Zn-dependent protease with chaperone function
LQPGNVLRRYYHPLDAQEFAMKRLAVVIAMLVSMLSGVYGSAFAQRVYYDQPRYVSVPTSNQVYTISQNGYQGTAYTISQLNGSVQRTEMLQSPQAILEALKAANKIPADIAPTVKVVRSDTLNAATDGQNIVITSGLLGRLTTNDQRAFVISHELSHIVLQHIAKTQFRRLGLSLLDQLLLRRYVSEGSLADMAAQLGINLYDKRNARVYEYQADDLGIQMMARSGYQTQSAIQVFQILQAATPGSRTPEFLQDHPITESRIRALAQKYNLSFR